MGAVNQYKIKDWKLFWQGGGEHIQLLELLLGNPVLHIHIGP